VLLPVPGLGLSQPWRIGHAVLHPAGSASSLITAARSSECGQASADFEKWIGSRIEVLDGSAVAEVENADDVSGAVALVASALSVLRVVQHAQNPMNDHQHQKFGLPGDVSSGVIDYVALGESITAGTARVGALAGWDLATRTMRHGRPTRRTAFSMRRS
jgi:hypothetical protein